MSRLQNRCNNEAELPVLSTQAILNNYAIGLVLHTVEVAADNTDLT